MAHSRPANEAFDRVVATEARFRVVIDTGTPWRDRGAFHPRSSPRPGGGTGRPHRGGPMPDPHAQTPAQQLIGDFAPKLVSLTDDVLFGDVWTRAELAPRDRSLITVAALIAGGNTEQLRSHLVRAKDNGLTETELKEV